MARIQEASSALIAQPRETSNCSASFRSEHLSWRADELAASVNSSQEPGNAVMTVATCVTIAQPASVPFSTLWPSLC